MDRIEDIKIIPAKFADNIDDNRCTINCLIGEDSMGNAVIHERIFENETIRHIKNPTYLFIGLIRGDNHITATFTDGKEFEDLFFDKWGVLTLK